MEREYVDYLVRSSEIFGTMGKRGSGGGGGASNAKELKMFMKNRMWRDHWYVIVAVVTIVVAVFSASVFQFSTSKDHIYRIDVTNEPLLARVFQSGEPWVVLCSKPDDIMPDVFSKASKRLADKSFAGVIDCMQQLPASGKTVLARFGIKKSISPTVFTVANGEKPKQVFLNYLQTSKALAKHVMEQTKKTAVEVLNSAQLDAKCLQKAECVLLLRGAKWKPYERQWIDRLLEEHRKVAFAWLDASVLKLSIEASLPKAKPGEHRLVLFKKQRDAGSKKKATVTAKAFRNVFELLAVRQFLEEALPSDLTPLVKAPTLSRRKTAPKAQPKDSDDAAPRESYAERRRRERRQAELERGSDSVFPEAADEPTVADGEVQSAADNGITDIVDEVIDLDELDE